MKRKRLLFAAIALVAGALNINAQDWTASPASAGSYFLYNVGEGKYLTGGNSWGTHGSLDAHGLYCTLVSNGDGFNIATGNGKYFGDNGFVDSGAAPWTFTAVEGLENTYTLYNSTYGYLVAVSGSSDLAASASAPTDGLGYWKLASREALIEAANLSEASEANPVDVTFLMSGANFVRNVDGYVNNPGQKTNEKSGPWTYTISGNNFVLSGPENQGQPNTGCEMWNNTFDLFQTLSVPNGKYYVTCDGFGSTNTVVYGNEVTAAFTKTGAVNGDNFANALLHINNYKEGGKTGVIIVSDGTLRVGVKRETNAGYEWSVIDNMRIYCVGTVDLSDIIAAYEEALGRAQALQAEKMNATALEALQTALTTYGNVDRTDQEALVEATSALNSAIAAAQPSVDAYQKLGPAIAKIDAALAAATSATTSADDYQAIKTAYNNGTIADADIPTNIIAAYEAVIPVIKSQTAASADFTLAIQNPSFEYGDLTGWTTIGSSSDTGVRETANATYAAEGTDGSYLFNTWWQGVPIIQTVEGLPNGEYTLTASVASDGATIYLLGNDEHNEGIETGGDYPDKSVMQETTFTFLVKDGIAKIGVVGGANGTAGEHKDYVEEGYWWYKADNFRLMKNRDLTEEELAVAPTAIALYNGETEVTETIPLDATANTVTLTPVFAPENATETVTWTSSDENVATVVNGVVTGVAPGTATITVTSTLDANVSASAEVTVSYPESTLPETTFVNDGPSRNFVQITGPNLIKNGSFEYPNAYYGWTYGTGSTTPITSEKFNIVTEGAANGNQYLQATANEGGAAAGSLNTSWEIEPGKTYVFGYKVKSTAASASTGNQYLGTSLNTKKGQENAERKMNNPVYSANEWTDVEYIFESGEYTYLVFNARWLANALSFDNFYLCEVTKTTEGNVDYATAAIPTSNIGDGAFQYSQDAIDAANALVQGEATVEDVVNAYKALTTLNAPAPDNKYGITIVTEGHPFIGNALVAGNGEITPNNPTGNVFNVKGDSPYLAQTFTFTSAENAEDPNLYYISVELPEGTVYLTNGANNGSAAGWAPSQIQGTTDSSKRLAFRIAASTTVEGAFNIINTANNYNVVAQDGGNIYTDENAQQNGEFALVEPTLVEVPVAVAAGKFATRIYPFKPAVANDGVVYYSCADASENELVLEEVAEPVANVPYILEATLDVNETQQGYSIAGAATYTDGWLTGVFAQTTITEGYVLQTKEGKQAFYIVNSEKPITVPAYRAYLTVSGSDVKSFNLGDDTTGISALEALTNNAFEAIYSADGVKLNRIEKGVNILKMSDGTTRKVILK